MIQVDVLLVKKVSTMTCWLGPNKFVVYEIPCNLVHFNFASHRIALLSLHERLWTTIPEDEYDGSVPGKALDCE